jgi:hypothetical protein
LLPANCCGIVAIQSQKCAFSKATIVDKLLLIIVVELLPAKCCEIVAIQKSKCFSKALYFFLVICHSLSKILDFFSKLKYSSFKACLSPAVFFLKEKGTHNAVQKLFIAPLYI